MVIVIADQYVSYLITILSYEADRGEKTINSTTWWTETVINFIILGLSSLVVFFFFFYTCDLCNVDWCSCMFMTSGGRSKEEPVKCSCRAA